MRLEHIRKFLLSEKWMAVLFVIAGVFACLHSFFPNGSIQIWGTVVLAYITGIVFVLSGDIFAMLIPGTFTYCIAIRCYDSLDDFKSIGFFAVPLVAMLLFNIIAYFKKPTVKGSQFLPMLFRRRRHLQYAWHRLRNAFDLLLFLLENQHEQGLSVN